MFRSRDKYGLDTSPTGARKPFTLLFLKTTNSVLLVAIDAVRDRKSFVPSKRRAGKPPPESAIHTACEAAVVCVASFLLTLWSCHVETWPVPSCTTPASALSQSCRPAS